jgi:hypothetical protein
MTTYPVVRPAPTYALILFSLFSFSCLVFAQTAPAPACPTNPKAQKTYQEALELARKNQIESAFDAFRKADKQDGGIALTASTAS